MGSAVQTSEFVQTTKAIADPLRCQVLQIMRDDSFAVGELCDIFATPQPAISHHLKVLHNAGLVSKHREANNIYYRRPMLDPADIRVRLLDAIDELSPARQLASGLNRIHRQRTKHSKQFFDESDGEPGLISSPNTYCDTVIDTIKHSDLKTQRVLEVGPGDGLLLTALAKMFKQATGIDNSDRQFNNTTNQLRLSCKNNSKINPNINLLNEDFLSHQPIKPYDAAVAAMVVHHLPSPQLFYQRAYTILAEHGVLVVVELCQHDQQWAKQACGDLWLGFDQQDLHSWAVAAGFATTASQYLTQKNGFRIQIQTCLKTKRSQNKSTK